jgi:hypothetical protein
MPQNSIERHPVVNVVEPKSAALRQTPTAVFQKLANGAMSIGEPSSQRPSIKIEIMDQYLLE